MNRKSLERTEMLIGEDAVERLWGKRVAIFGIGGVGGYAVEALARSGVGTLDIIDKDIVSVSNLNRQIIALTNTIGLPKVEVMKQRIMLINPDIKVNTSQCFYLPETRNQFHFSDFDYVIDAVDTVTAKIDIIVSCQNANVPIISCMGAGNKLDPTAFRVEDIYKTSVCPLARVMRHELKQRGIKQCKVVYSMEQSIQPSNIADGGKGDRPAPGSIAFVPSVAGMILAGEVIKDLTK